MVIKLARTYVSKPAPPSRSSEDPGTEDIIRGHLPNESAEEYLLNKSAEADLAGIEQHLLLCDQCRARLERMEPFNCIRYIEDGPVHESVTRLTTGEIMARHRSQDLHAGKVFGS